MPEVRKSVLAGPEVHMPSLLASLLFKDWPRLYVLHGAVLANSVREQLEP